MKATGILRRVDDLGRVVIPKEIRRNLGIAEGDPLEIFVDPTNDMVCFQRYERDSVKNILMKAIKEVENCEGIERGIHLREVLARNGYKVN